MTSTANDIQYGGDHYKTQGVQHWDLMADYHVPYLEGNASKYGYRWPKKNGLEDLSKFGHYVQKVLEKHRNEGYQPRAAMPQHVWWNFCVENSVDPDSYLATWKAISWRSEADLLEALDYIKRLMLKASYSG